jgi:hypothetical protein
MIFFFNLNKLESSTRNDPEYLVVALYKCFLGIRIPKNAREKYKPILGLEAGSSYLLNPKLLFEDKITDAVFKAQYIRLAGRRDYLSYKTIKQKHLDLTLYPDLNIATLKHNPLLIIENTHLKFIYEETNGTLI